MKNTGLNTIKNKGFKLMKKVIVLVDMDNSKFLIIKEKDTWKLPTLENIKRIDEIEMNFEKKYKNKIRNIELIEETQDYFLVKCFISEKIKDLVYKNEVINELYSEISNEQQKQILLEISKQIYMEIINDSFWLGIILTVEDKIISSECKGILSDFLLFFSSIFCAEVINYKFGENKEKNIIDNREIKKIRKFYLKEAPLYSSKYISTLIEEMGIDFDNFAFDIVIYMLNNELIDINSRLWYKKENDLCNSIIMSTRKWIKNCLSENNELFEELRRPYVEEFISRFNKNKIIKRTYSTYKLFDKGLSHNEKIYILQRIGLIKTIIMISNVMGKGNYIIIDGKERVCLNFDRFLIKAKATIIELLWNDNNKNEIPFLKEIMKKLEDKMDEKFYKLNRKCRNNLHYGFYHKISDFQYEELRNMQDIYLNYIVDEFQKKINIKFGFEYKIALWIAKIQYWDIN